MEGWSLQGDLCVRHYTTSVKLLKASTMCRPGHDGVTVTAVWGWVTIQNWEKEGKNAKGTQKNMSSICAGEGCCLNSTLFSASQVGWFPSTYVEEEDWLFCTNDVFSASIQSWPPPVSATLLSHSPRPASQISLIKPRDSDWRGSGSALKKPSPALWQAHKQSRCQITDSRSVTPYLASLRSCLPPQPTGECMYCAQITLSPPSLLTLSYYWWLHWLVWDLPSLSSCFNTRKAQSSNWNTGPADGALPRYSTKLTCRSCNCCWNTIALLVAWTFVFNFLSETHFIFQIFNHRTDTNNVIFKCNSWIVVWRLRKKGGKIAPQREGLICHPHVMRLQSIMTISLVEREVIRPHHDRKPHVEKKQLMMWLWKGLNCTTEIAMSLSFPLLFFYIAVCLNHHLNFKYHLHEALDWC